METVSHRLTKKPFVRLRPSYKELPTFTTRPNDAIPVCDGLREFEVLSQADFLREYYPTGHKVNDTTYYPNRIKKDPDTGQLYEIKVVRTSFAFQQIIALKHTITLCGNDIQFSLSQTSESDEAKQRFFDFIAAWETHDMEIAWYELVRSAKITGDAAIVGYMLDGKFRWKTLSYLNGDTLYPHYDSVTGHLSCFLRKYSDTDEAGCETCRYVEMWDDTTMYRFRQQRKGVKGALNKLAESLGLDGYELVSSELHGFAFCPVAYIRTDGPCWQFSQDSIDQYELSFSYLSQNNMAFAFPIMYGKGDTISVSGDAATDSVKFITVDEDGEVGFLNPPDGSSFFTTEIQKLYDMILEQSFVAKPPEVKSGDMPAAAIKLLYSPAIERAMEDAALYKRTLNALVHVFTYGFGIESEQLTTYLSLPISYYIEPYIHQNVSELINNLATAVQNGFLSVETATERARVYSTPQEFDRIMREYKEKQQQDILESLRSTNTSDTEDSESEEYGNNDENEANVKDGVGK